MKVLKFHAVWCNPCKMVAKMFENYKGLEVESVDIDDNIELTAKHKIMSVPTIVVVDENGEEVDRVVGVPSGLSFLDKYKK